MALLSGFMTPEDWERFFIEAGISTDSAKNHATELPREDYYLRRRRTIYRASDCPHRVTSLHGDCGGKFYYYFYIRLLTFIYTCWTFTATKQWSWGQLVCAKYVSIYATTATVVKTTVFRQRPDQLIGTNYVIKRCTTWQRFLVNDGEIASIKKKNWVASTGAYFPGRDMQAHVYQYQ